LGGEASGDGFDDRQRHGHRLHIVEPHGIAIHGGVVPVGEVKVRGNRCGEDAALALGEGDDFGVGGGEGLGLAEDTTIGFLGRNHGEKQENGCKLMEFCLCSGRYQRDRPI
jgi:hypothetical protein